MKFTIAGKEVEVDDAVLSKALEEKTETLPITTDLVIRTPEEEITFKKNMKAENMAEGVEVAVKTVKREMNLDFPGKDIKALAEAAKELGATEAKVPTDKKVERLEKDLDLVKKENITLKDRAEKAEGGFSSFKQQIEIDKEIAEALPANTLLEKNDMMTILKANLTFGTDEAGKRIVTGPDGEVFKNPSTAEYKSPKEVIEDFLKSNPKYLKPKEGGSGAGDSNTEGDKVKKPLSKFIEEMQAKNINVNSPEFNAALEAEKENIDQEA